MSFFTLTHILSVVVLLLSLAALSVSAADSCPSPPLSDLQADIEALRAQLATARESVAELQSSISALTGALRQPSTSAFSARSTLPYTNVTFSEMIDGAIAVRAFLGAAGAFLMEESSAIEQEGDTILGNIWQSVGTALIVALQTEPVMIFDAIAPVIAAFPDLSSAPTTCGKARLIVHAYAGKTLLVPGPNPKYSLKTAGTQPRYKLHALNLATDPVFGIIAAAAEACALSDASPCDAIKGVVSNLVDNGPLWMQAMLNADRVENINRLLSYLCGQEVPPRSTAPRLEQQQQQGNEAPNPNPAAFDKSKLDAVVSEEVQKRRAREKADKAQENMA